MIDPDEVVEYDGALMAVKDIPDPDARRLLGYGHFPEPGREVIEHPDGEDWPFRPEVCPRADELKGIWIHDGQYLVCPGCGMDYT